MSAAKLTPYRCRHCRQVVKRPSTKAWIPSYCDTTGKMVRLMRQSGTPTGEQRCQISSD